MCPTQTISQTDLAATSSSVGEVLALFGIFWLVTESIILSSLILCSSMAADRVTRMYSYLQRHEVDKEGEGFSPDEDGFPSAGRIAWALWGGDAAVKWSERKRNEIIAEEEKDERNLKNYNQMEKRIFLLLYLE